MACGSACAGDPMRGTKWATPQWQSEAAMLASWRAEVTDPDGWEWWPETGGHDVILRREGIVVAVEAKLRANAHLLYQALPPWRRRTDIAPSAADFYVAVVPGQDFEFGVLAAALNIVAVSHSADPAQRHHRFRSGGGLVLGDQHRRPPESTRALVLPSVRVEVVAGSPAPRMVTAWKLAAVRLCLFPPAVISSATVAPALLRSFVERQEPWLRAVAKDGRRTVYELVAAPDRPDLAYPEVAAALRLQP